LGAPVAIVPYYRFKKCREFPYRYFGGIACAPAVKERSSFFSCIGSDDPQYPNGGKAGATEAIICHETGFPMKITAFWNY